MGSVTRTGGTSRSVTAIIRHSGYNPNTIANDIAVLRISAVSLSNNIKIVKLPPRSSSYSTYAGVTVTISGWGKTSDCKFFNTKQIMLRYCVTFVCNRMYVTLIQQHPVFRPD